jgi:hypothetical protein
MIVPLDAYRTVRYADRGMPNPFEFSDPVLGDSFADRKSELKTLTTRMLAGQNVIVISPRRYGKTSLILNAQAAEPASPISFGARTGRTLPKSWPTRLSTAPLGRCVVGSKSCGDG